MMYCILYVEQLEDFRAASPCSVGFVTLQLITASNLASSVSSRSQPAARQVERTWILISSMQHCISTATPCAPSLPHACPQ